MTVCPLKVHPRCLWSWTIDVFCCNMRYYVVLLWHHTFCVSRIVNFWTMETCCSNHPGRRIWGMLEVGVASRAGYVLHHASRKVKHNSVAFLLQERCEKQHTHTFHSLLDLGSSDWGFHARLTTLLSKRIISAKFKQVKNGMCNWSQVWQNLPREFIAQRRGCFNNYDDHY